MKRPEKTINSAQADSLLKLSVAKIKATFKERVISIFKIGSLGKHGDFSLCSDVDVALMLDTIKKSDYDTIKEISNGIKTSNLPFADRLSIYWSSYNTATFERGEGRFPALDRLDLIRYGVLLTGIDRRRELPEPSNNDIILESAEFISKYMLADEKFNALVMDQADIARRGSRYFSKFVLFPVRLLYTLDNPDKLGSNYDSVEHFKKFYGNTIPHATGLIEIAYQSRNNYPNAPVTVNLDSLKIVLPTLYLYCIEQYHKAALHLKRNDIATTLQLESERIKAKVEKINVITAQDGR